MNKEAREELRIRFTITLTMLPKQVRNDLGERITSKKDPAVAAIVEALIAALERDFEVDARPHSAVRPRINY